MKHLILTAILLSSCAMEAPVEGRNNDAWNEGYDACIADTTTPKISIDALQAELTALKEDLHWCEFYLEDEQAVFDIELAKCTDVTLNLYWKIDQLQKQGCELP